MAHRLVVLGASNVVRGLPTLMAAARQAWGDPLELVAAHGHGRSYGLRSLVLGRALPGIVECGLWDALRTRPPRPTRALLADVGNDIAYGASPQDVLRWVEACVVRLQDAGAEVRVAGLPLERLQRVSPAGYRVTHAVFYPRHPRLGFAEALARVQAVVAGLQELAERRGATFVPLRPEWYGLDPIHLRPRAWRPAWRALLLGPAAAAAPGPGAGASWLRLYALRPERQWLLGREQRRAQPALELPGGGSVSFF